MAREGLTHSGCRAPTLEREDVNPGTERVLNARAEWQAGLVHNRRRTLGCGWERSRCKSDVSHRRDACMIRTKQPTVVRCERREAGNAFPAGLVEDVQCRLIDARRRIREVERPDA
jgi:hypothetical protein